MTLDSATVLDRKPKAQATKKKINWATSKLNTPVLQTTPARK